MGEFNIANSKIDQLNDQGDNYKISGNAAPVAITGGGGAAQTVGNKNKTQVAQPTSGCWGKVKAAAKSVWKWLTGG